MKKFRIYALAILLSLSVCAVTACRNGSSGNNLSSSQSSGVSESTGGAGQKNRTESAPGGSVTESGDSDMDGLGGTGMTNGSDSTGSGVDPDNLTGKNGSNSSSDSSLSESSTGVIDGLMDDVEDGVEDLIGDADGESHNADEAGK